MNKIYIVEMYGFDDYKRYGIFAKIEDARKLLQKVFEEEKSFYENIKDPIYDCEYTTNSILESLLACDLMKAKEWIADNYNYYNQIARQCNNRLIKPWE